VASKPKNKMPARQRAKQFLPFAAVQGLDIALAKKEEEVTSTSSSCTVQKGKIKHLTKK